MKFHWGHGIILAFVFFAILILSLVFGSLRHDNELVSKEYYAEEIRYQDRIEEIKNNQKLANPAQVLFENGGVILKISTPKPTGNVLFFRPSNASKDFSIPLEVKDSLQVIPTKNLEKGLWRVKIAWQSESKEYFYEQKITIK